MIYITFDYVEVQCNCWLFDMVYKKRGAGNVFTCGILDL